MARVLVTGGTGFIGSHLVRGLVARGDAVVVLSRAGADRRRLADVRDRLTLIELPAASGDLAATAQPTLFEAAGPIDAVIHLATAYGRSDEPASSLLESNLLWPIRLLEAATVARVPLFINTDTFFSRGGSGYLGPYSLAKRHVVEWARQATTAPRPPDHRRLRIVNLQLEHVFGEDDRPEKFVPMVIRQCLANAAELPLTGGEHRRDFIHVSDVVTAYLRLLEPFDAADPRSSDPSDRFAEYQIGTGEAVTVRHLVEEIHRRCGSTTSLRFGQVAYRDGELATSQANRESAGLPGWRPQLTLAAALDRTIDWYRQR